MKTETEGNKEGKKERCIRMKMVVKKGKERTKEESTDNY
jgi:hypothetical protein